MTFLDDKPVETVEDRFYEALARLRDACDMMDQEQLYDWDWEPNEHSIESIEFLTLQVLNP